MIENQVGFFREKVRGMSQEQLAKKIGKKRNVLSAIELGKRIPQLETALIIAKALDASVEDLFMLKD